MNDLDGRANGDTVDISGERIRIANIDAPELHQWKNLFRFVVVRMTEIDEPAAKRHDQL